MSLLYHSQPTWQNSTSDDTTILIVGEILYDIHHRRKHNICTSYDSSSTIFICHNEQKKKKKIKLLDARNKINLKYTMRHQFTYKYMCRLRCLINGIQICYVWIPEPYRCVGAIKNFIIITSFFCNKVVFSV